MTNTNWREEFNKFQIMRGYNFNEQDSAELSLFIQQQINKAEERGYKQGFIDCGIAYENGIKSALSISNLPTNE